VGVFCGHTPGDVFPGLDFDIGCEFVRALLILLFSRPQDAIHRAYQPVPATCVFDELFAASRRQAVIPRLAVVLRSPPEGRDPTSVFEPVQRRVKRAVLDLQNFFRAVLDDVGNCVAVRRAQNQRLQNEQVQCALQHFAFKRMSFSGWHLLPIIP
jgi:hypothetical protein